MRRYLYTGRGAFEISDAPDAGAERLGFQDSGEAFAYLEQFQDDPMNLTTLRQLYDEAMPLGRGNSMPGRQILRQVARQCMTGAIKPVPQGIRLRVREDGQSRSPGGDQPEPEPPPQEDPYLASEEEYFQEPEPVAEPEPTDEEHVDALAQASALKQAATVGLPFCEECEKARQAQASAQPSTASTQPSAASTQPSAASTQPSTASTQPSTASTQPSAVGAQPGPAGGQQTQASPASEPGDAANIDAAAQVAVLKEAAAEGAPLCEECEKAKQEQEAVAV